MRIGELAADLGVPVDTIRFYERSGLLSGPTRKANGYRDYRPEDASHLRLLIDLRRLDVPLDIAASLARSCHAGHCSTASGELPLQIGRQRGEIRARMDGLRALDDRLADLERHLREQPPTRAAGDVSATGSLRARLPVLEESGPCCDAASAVIGVAEGGCACCSPVPG